MTRARLALVAAALAGAVALALVLSTGDDDGPPEPRAPRPPAAAPAPPPPPDPAGPPALPAPAGTALGVSVNWLFTGATYTPAKVGRELEAIRAAGVPLARTDAFWHLAEPAPPQAGVHRYDWTYADGVAGELARRGIEWLAILGYAAPWAASVEGDLQSPPRSADDFAAYARAFAQRYGRGGSFWAERPELTARPVTTYEIWNEPDVADFWAPAPDPARYMDLYLRSRTQIKAVDAQARVIIGGLTGAPTFLPQLLGARPDARGHLDGVAVHTYSPTGLGALAEVRDARRALAGLGLAEVPLYVTEYGWVSRPRNSNKYAPPGERAERIASTTSALTRTDCGVAAAVLYAWITPGRNPRAESDWYGIRDRNGGPTRASRAFAREVARAADPEAGPPVRLCAEP